MHVFPYLSTKGEGIKQCELFLILIESQVLFAQLLKSSSSAFLQALDPDMRSCLPHVVGSVYCSGSYAHSRLLFLACFMGKLGPWLKIERGPKRKRLIATFWFAFAAHFSPTLFFAFALRFLLCFSFCFCCCLCCCCFCVYHFDGWA